MLCSLVVMLSTALILKGNDSLFSKTGRNDQLEWGRSMRRAASWVWCVLMAQGEPWEPRGRSVRVVAGLWLVAAFLLGIVYRSNLKAMLIVRRVTLPFDSLEELVQSRLQCRPIKEHHISRIEKRGHASFPSCHPILHRKLDTQSNYCHNSSAAMRDTR
ncbi:hypothetical protein Pmani_017987 [Petrolisthes manimaculis]|nr:hypothetical protein Pmani_017987 [Petrolisthes manimaculis]